MSRINRIKEELDGLQTVLDKDIELQNGMAKTTYKLVKRIYGECYGELVGQLHSSGLADEDIAELDMSFLREDFMKNHKYISEDTDYSLCEDEQLEFENVHRVRGVGKCKICGSETCYQNEHGEFICSRICNYIINS